jgi:hypothetical protein
MEGAGGEAGTDSVPELEEQWGYGGWREESKSQLEGVLVFFFSSSGNRTMGLCLQKKTYSVSSQ